MRGLCTWGKSKEEGAQELREEGQGEPECEQAARRGCPLAGGGRQPLPGSRPSCIGTAVSVEWSSGSEMACKRGLTLPFDALICISLITSEFKHLLICLFAFLLLQ